MSRHDDIDFAHAQPIAVARANYAPASSASVEVLERHLQTVAARLVAGETWILPLFVRLECEIEKAREAQDVIARARMIAAGTISAA